MLTLPLVYLTTVLEYLAAETLELISNADRNNKKQHIVPHCYESSLSYLARRPGLVGFQMRRGVWTVASARALCQPSVAVQVFRR